MCAQYRRVVKEETLLFSYTSTRGYMDRYCFFYILDFTILRTVARVMYYTFSGNRIPVLFSGQRWAMFCLLLCSLIPVKLRRIRLRETMESKYLLIFQRQLAISTFQGLTGFEFSTNACIINIQFYLTEQRIKSIDTMWCWKLTCNIKKTFSLNGCIWIWLKSQVYRMSQKKKSCIYERKLILPWTEVTFVSLVDQSPVHLSLHYSRTFVHELFNMATAYTSCYYKCSHRTKSRITIDFPLIYYTAEYNVARSSDFSHYIKVWCFVHAWIFPAVRNKPVSTKIASIFAQQFDTSYIIRRIRLRKCSSIACKKQRIAKR